MSNEPASAYVCSRQPRPVARSLMVWLLLGFVAFEGFSLVAPSLTRPLPNAGLALGEDHDQLDLGEAWVQDDLQHVLTVRNPTHAEIHVSDVKTHCICSAVEPRRFTIQPGGAVDLRLKLNLSLVNPPVGGEPRQLFELDVLPKIDGDQGLPVPWRVKGTIKNAFALSSAFIGYGGLDEIIAGSAPCAKSIAIMPYADISRFEARCEPVLGTAVVDREGANSVLHFTPASGLAVGSFEGAVSLVAILVTGEVVPPVSVKVVGKVVRDTQVVPDEIQFGSVSVGEVAEQTLLLQSRAGRQFAVVECVKRPPGVDVTDVSAGATAGRSFHVKVRCGSAGLWQSTLTFRIKPSDGGSVDLDVPVALYGVRRPQAGSEVPETGDAETRDADAAENE